PTTSSICRPSRDTEDITGLHSRAALRHGAPRASTEKELIGFADVGPSGQTGQSSSTTAMRSSGTSYGSCALSVFTPSAVSGSGTGSVELIWSIPSLRPRDFGSQGKALRHYAAWLQRFIADRQLLQI